MLKRRGNLVDSLAVERLEPEESEQARPRFETTVPKPPPVFTPTLNPCANEPGDDRHRDASEDREESEEGRVHGREFIGGVGLRARSATGRRALGTRSANVLVLLVDRGELMLAVDLGKGSGDGGCADSEHARDLRDALAL